MAAFLWVGKPGNGKSYESARTTQRLLRRNIKWYKKARKRWLNKIKYTKGKWAETHSEPKRRLVWNNLKISDEWLNNKRHAEAKEFIRYYDDILDVALHAEHADVVIDEVGRYCDARDWSEVHPEVKAFFSEADKRGVDLYMNTQYPKSVDVLVRRSCEKMWLIRKLFGSKRPDETKPPVRFLWGLLWISEIDPISFESEIEEMIFKPPSFWFFYIWNFRWINSYVTDFYDTKWRIKHKFAPLEHQERTCPECGKLHIKHK